MNGADGVSGVPLLLLLLAAGVVGRSASSFASPVTCSWLAGHVDDDDNVSVCFLFGACAYIHLWVFFVPGVRCG